MRRLTSRRTQLIRQRTRTKNEISAVLRNLKGRPPVTDVFGKKGRAWLAGLVLPVDERQTVQGCLRQLDFLGGEIDLIDRALAEQALVSQEIRRLMTIPGVGVTTAATVMATIGASSASRPLSASLVISVWTPAAASPALRRPGTGDLQAGLFSRAARAR